MDRSEFHKIEYQSLREEILASQAARRSLEQVGAGMIAALYGWLSSKEAVAGAPLADLAWWVAPVIALGVAWRSNSLSQGIRKAGRYLARLEETLPGPKRDGPKGWHAELAAERKAAAGKAEAREAGKSGLRRTIDALAALLLMPVTLLRGRKAGLDSEKDKTNLTWYVVSLVTLAIAFRVSFGSEIAALLAVG